MDRLILLDDILENLQHLGKQRAILNYVSVMHQRSCDSGQIWKHGGCQNIKTKRRFKFNPMRLVELIKKRYQLETGHSLSIYCFDQFISNHSWIMHIENAGDHNSNVWEKLF